MGAMNFDPPESTENEPQRGGAARKPESEGATSDDEGPVMRSGTLKDWRSVEKTAESADETDPKKAQTTEQQPETLRSGTLIDWRSAEPRDKVTDTDDQASDQSTAPEGVRDPGNTMRGC